jgi:hypothetical protein
MYIYCIVIIMREFLNIPERCVDCPLLWDRRAEFNEAHVDPEALANETEIISAEIEHVLRRLPPDEYPAERDFEDARARARKNAAELLDDAEQKQTTVQSNVDLLTSNCEDGPKTGTIDGTIIVRICGSLILRGSTIEKAEVDRKALTD